MPPSRVWLQLIVPVLLACGSEPRAPKPPEFAEAFSSLPLPPSPEFVSQAGGAGARQITVHTPAEEARVTDYYRNFLSRGNWRLVSDVKSRDGVTALYAEQDGPPLWVRIWPAKDRRGTMVQLTGAAPTKDSTRADSVGDSAVNR